MSTSRVTAEAINAGIRNWLSQNLIPEPRSCSQSAAPQKTTTLVATQIPPWPPALTTQSVCDLLSVWIEAQIRLGRHAR
jgi:hypothetical protein